MADISLNMIVGPFDEPFIEEAILSVSPIINEAIVIDTAPGVNHNIEKILHIPKVRVIELPRPEYDRDFDFSLARNTARENSSSEWILRLDADEVLHEDYLPHLEDFAKTTKEHVIEIKFWHHVLHPDLYQELKDDIKIFMMRREKFRWFKKVHEYIEVEGDYRREHNIKLNHYGYLRGQPEVFKRWLLYKELGGMPIDLTNVNPDTFLSEMRDVLKDYPGVHPSIVIPKLKNMYPDMRT